MKFLLPILSLNLKITPRSSLIATVYDNFTPHGNYTINSITHPLQTIWEAEVAVMALYLNCELIKHVVTILLMDV